MKIEVSLTKAEARALVQRAKRYKTDAGRVQVVDLGPTISWPDGIRKSKARESAERKLLAALESEGDA